MPETKITNEQQSKVYFGLHMMPGVAEYEGADGEGYRIFLNEATIKRMDPTFQGRPVYVQHQNAPIEDLNKVDGWVVRSFFNEADGRHWAEFMVVTEKGHEAIKKGFRLSNAYHPTYLPNSGGLWNGVEYREEVSEAAYDHLALVKNPRYDESIILDGPAFKEYNERKRSEMKMLSNSKKGDGDMGVKTLFFKKSPVENDLASELEKYSVVLPKSKLTVTVAEAIEKADILENMHGYANSDHMVKVNDDEEMSVGDLVNKCNSQAEELKKNAEKADKVEPEEKNEADKKDDEKKDDKKENQISPEDKKEEQDIFNDVRNAASKGKVQNTAPAVETSLHKVQRGKSLFGSESK